VKPEQDRGKDPLPSSSTAREEAALTGLGRPADSALVQKAHTASAEAFVQPAGGELKTGSGTPQADNLAAARSNPVFTQVEGSIRWIIQNKSQEAELQLHPDSLGRVTIQLKVEGQEVHAHLWASEASSLPILQEHKASLEASLKEQGLNLGSFNLHFGARHDQSQTASQTWNMSHASKSFLSAEGKQEIPSRSADPGLLSSMDPHQIEVYA
jgi:flagellar hook-length control protein FliK